MTRANEQSGMVAPKFFVNGGLLFGVSGVVRAMDIIETTRFPPYDGTDPRKWLIMSLVPVLRAAFEDEPGMVSDDGQMDGFGILVVVGGQAFGFDSRLSPGQTTDGIYTMGSGGDYARGALFAGATVMEALHAASAIDPYTGGALMVTSASKYLEAHADDEVPL